MIGQKDRPHYHTSNNQTLKTDSKGVTRYTYDSLNRLESVTEPVENGYIRSTKYAYDKADNRLTTTVIASGSEAILSLIIYIYNEQNRLQKAMIINNGEVDTTTYTYDANGNTISSAKAVVKNAVEGSTPSLGITLLGSLCHNEPIMYIDPTGHIDKNFDSKLSSSDKARITTLTSAYNFAKKAGLTKIAEDAHRAAVTIRKAYDKDYADTYKYTTTKNVGNNSTSYSNGAKGSTVKTIQNALVNNGYSVGAYGSDSDFGNATAAAVVRYQVDTLRNNISGDELYYNGVVDAKTMASLGITIPTQQKKSTSNQQSNATVLTNNNKTEINNTSNWVDSTLSYVKDSGEQVVMGNYTKKVTVLGTAGQVATGVIGVDLPADIRDLSDWKWTWGHAGQTTMDGIGLLPVIGVLKNADDE